VELGGKVIVPAYNVPSVGRMAHLQDAQGVLFAVSYQEERRGYREPEPGDFSWHELMTTNMQTAWDFYSKLFGWQKMEAIDMGPAGPYQIFGAAGHQLGGMFAPGPVPGGPMWLPYVLVRDAKRSADTAKELGATITQGPMEVPGGDWVFTGLDRQGAAFGIHSKKRVAAAVKPVRPARPASAPRPKKSTKPATSRKTTRAARKTTSKRKRR
jgi:predicted enzyme related to lactoylglutathione lyase